MLNKTNETLNTFSIKPKLIILTSISMIGMAIIFVLFLNSITKSLYAEREMHIEKLLDTGYNILDHFYTLQQENKLTQEEAQALVVNTLKSAKYGPNGYFWIIDTKGVIIMHPYAQEIVGKSALSIKDSNGGYMFVDFVEKAKAGGGFVEYYWPKPNSDISYKKISNISLFNQWGWSIGTGIYVDDIEKDIESIAYKIISIITIIFIIISLISIYMSNKFLRQMSDLAMYDPLTSLYNRRYMYQETSALVSNHDRYGEKYLAVIFLDIDLFKNINDTYGHSYGDKVISFVGESILKSIRAGDIAIRYGGEEFLVIMLCNNKDEALDVATRIRDNVSQMDTDKDISLTLSAGIAFRDTDEKFEKVIERADSKLYKAKEAGRDCIKY
ncbi:diguanylate cyclase [Sulfurimonas sp.]|nr:diguanylate cyclase [Sulfurimonas sp.]